MRVRTGHLLRSHMPRLSDVPEWEMHPQSGKLRRLLRPMPGQRLRSGGRLQLSVRLQCAQRMLCGRSNVQFLGAVCELADLVVPTEVVGPLRLSHGTMLPGISHVGQSRATSGPSTSSGRRSHPCPKRPIRTGKKSEKIACIFALPDWDSLRAPGRRAVSTIRGGKRTREIGSIAQHPLPVRRRHPRRDPAVE